MAKFQFSIVNPNDEVDRVNFSIEMDANYTVTDQWMKDVVYLFADPANFLPGVSWVSAEKGSIVTFENREISPNP